MQHAQASTIAISSLVASADAPPVALPYAGAPLPYLPSMQLPSAQSISPVFVAVATDPLEKINSMLEAGAMLKHEASSSSMPPSLRDTTRARKANMRWRQMCTPLEEEYRRLLRDMIPDYELPWRLPACALRSDRGKATKVLYIQLMVAEIQGVAEIKRFASSMEGLWGINEVFVRADNVDKFQSMPIPIPLPGICSRLRKSINCIWNRAGFDVAKKCVHNKAHCVVLRFDLAILVKHQDFYSKAHSPKKPLSGDAQGSGTDGDD